MAGIKNTGNAREMSRNPGELTEPELAVVLKAHQRLPEPFRQMGSMEFAMQLMDKANVAVAPGIGFGEEGEGWLRLALVEDEHRIRQALRQMKRALPEIDPVI